MQVKKTPISAVSRVNLKQLVGMVVIGMAPMLGGCRPPVHAMQFNQFSWSYPSQASANRPSKHHRRGIAIKAAAHDEREGDSVVTTSTPTLVEKVGRDEYGSVSTCSRSSTPSATGLTFVGVLRARKFVRFMHLASPYVAGHRGRLMVLAIPGEVR
jgi:hypothetical protein